MVLVIQCPQCRKSAQIAEGYAGRPVRCPACQNIFTARAVSQSQGAVGNGMSPPVGHVEGAAKSSNVSRLADRCPSCKGTLPEGAGHCPDCGWMKGDAPAIQTDAQPLVCTNPACGVANPATERYCQRCNTMLPSVPGTLLQGRYRVERLLAIGGFGAVYLASDVQTGGAVAIKDMISSDPSEFQLRLNFFRREAEMLRSLKHLPIVPKMYDFIEQGQSAYLVMEYIRGRDLLKVMEMNQGRPFPIDLIAQWGASVCEVLEQMHTLQPPVIHRDLKPDNLMLLEDGHQIKLIDYGTARDMERGPHARASTATRVYTEGYAPPEQIVGKPEIRSDLFALAGTLYHLATGKAPEGHYTGRELEGQLKNGNGAIRSEHRWFYELVKINLAEDANDRYFSAQELRSDLAQRKVTTEIQCAKCQQVNSARTPYCSRCTKPLTPPAPACYYCNRINRLGSRYCIYCGHHLR